MLLLLLPATKWKRPFLMEFFFFIHLLLLYAFHFFWVVFVSFPASNVTTTVVNWCTLEGTFKLLFIRPQRKNSGSLHLLIGSEILSNFFICHLPWFLSNRFKWAWIIYVTMLRSCSTVAQHLFMIYFSNERYCYWNVFPHFYVWIVIFFPSSFPWPTQNIRHNFIFAPFHFI